MRIFSWIQKFYHLLSKLAGISDSTGQIFPTFHHILFVLVGDYFPPELFFLIDLVKHMDLSNKPGNRLRSELKSFSFWLSPLFFFFVVDLSVSLEILVNLILFLILFPEELSFQVFFLFHLFCKLFVSLRIYFDWDWICLEFIFQLLFIF